MIIKLIAEAQDLKSLPKDINGYGIDKHASTSGSSAAASIGTNISPLSSKGGIWIWCHGRSTLGMKPVSRFEFKKCSRDKLKGINADEDGPTPR